MSLLLVCVIRFVCVCESVLCVIVVLCVMFWVCVIVVVCNVVSVCSCRCVSVFVCFGGLQPSNDNFCLPLTLLQWKAISVN